MNSVCSELVLSDTKIDLKLSVTPKLQRSQVHMRDDLKDRLLDTECRIMPSLDSSGLS